MSKIRTEATDVRLFRSRRFMLDRIQHPIGYAEGTERQTGLAVALEGVAQMAKKGRAIYLVYTDLADDKYDEEFNAWYDTRHLPQLKAIPGILDAARYVAVKGGPKYLAVYELESAEVVRSDAFVNRPKHSVGRADVATGHRQELHARPRRADLPRRAGER